MPQRRSKTPHATAKTQHSQINKHFFERLKRSQDAQIMTVSLAVLLEHLIHEFSTGTHRAAHSPSVKRVDCILNVISVTMRTSQKTVTSGITSREMEKTGRNSSLFHVHFKGRSRTQPPARGSYPWSSSSSNFITIMAALTACDISELSCLFCPYTWSAP